MNSISEQSRKNLKQIQEVQDEYAQPNSLIDSGNLSFALEVSIKTIRDLIFENDRLQQYTRTGIELSRKKLEVARMVTRLSILVGALKNIQRGILPNGDHVDGTVSLYAEDALKQLVELNEAETKDGI